MSGVKRNAILTSELRMFMDFSVKFRTELKFIDIVRLNRGDKFDVRRFLSYISFSISKSLCSLIKEIIRDKRKQHAKLYELFKVQRSLRHLINKFPFLYP